MAIRINFDLAHNPETPSMVLAKKNGDRLGLLNAKAISVADSMNDASEISFNINKYVDGQKCDLWDEIVDFKLIHCVEWDVWFEITVQLDEATETKKTVFCTRLGHAELSQIMIYDTEINTENDIAREDYEIPTIFFDATHPEASLLHRILEKAPHYRVIHVDSTIAKIQRTFTFSDVSIYDAFQQIAEEIHCLFVLHSNSDENGNIQRTISVYDLETNCNDCGYRGEYTGVCPECGSINLNEGYGEDTNIFISSDELADDIQLSADTGSIKNCFKLEAGDDLMTATIRNCNPNGTDYIWYISDKVKADMSEALVEKLRAYDEQYAYYQKSFVAVLGSSKLSAYNQLVQKYRVYNSELEEIKTPIQGYSALMNAYYNTIDLANYLDSVLMPDASMSETSAVLEAAKLTAENLSPVAVTDVTYLSLITADNAVLSMAKVVADSRYKIQVDTSSLDTSTKVWTGNFILTNYSDEEDTAVSETVSIAISDDYASFVKQKIQKSLNKDDTEDLSISGLFEKTETEFAAELKKYCLNSLTSFLNACQSCMDIMIEQGVGNQGTWAGQDPNLYDDLYVPYLNKLSAIEAEIKLRQSEIELITGVYDENGELKTNGLQTDIEAIKLDIQQNLDFEYYLGEELWLEFCAFRREDKYSNSNYISDGLNNAELFDKANEFIEVAQKEIYKSAELQHSISTTLKNLLVLKKFSRLVEKFEVGNWLRIMVDDELYKLRLIHYEIDYDNLDNIKVDFSDVVKINSPIKSMQGVLAQASTMATSYSSVQRQAKQGEKSQATLKNWTKNGLDTTNTKIMGGADNQTQTWDRHGMLFRKYDAITDTYDSIQLKIINSTISITDDNWQTVKTAIGAYYYFHPETGKLTRAYGVNGEVIIGKLLLGEQLGIYNESGSLSFDNNGFRITNNINSFRVNPNSDVLLAISNGDKDVFYIDASGTLHISADGTGMDVSANSDITAMQSQITQNKEAISLETDRAIKAEDNLSDSILECSSQIKLNAESITGLVTKTDGLSTSFSKLEQKVDSFTLSVDNGETSSTIKLMAGETEMSSQEIKLKGVVTFTDLSTESESTIINGSNIKSGTITGVKFVSEDGVYGKVEIDNGQIEWMTDEGYTCGIISMGDGMALTIYSYSGMSFDLKSDSALYLGAATNVEIDSTSGHIHINAKAGNVYIGDDGTSDVEIGAEGKNVYLKGNIYINGVLYTGSTESGGSDNSGDSGETTAPVEETPVE